jgi:hypothetical protein
MSAYKLGSLGAAKEFLCSVGFLLGKEEHGQPTGARTAGPTGARTADRGTDSRADRGTDSRQGHG